MFPFHKSRDLPGEYTGTTLVMALYIAFLLLLLAGEMFPDSFLWGVHILAFVPAPMRLGILLLSLLLAFPPFSQNYLPGISAKLFPPGAFTPGRLVGILFVGIAAGVLFYLWRISIDMYGDARSLLLILAGKKFTLMDVLRFNDFEPLTRFLHQKISVVTGIDQKLVYQIVSAASGGLFVMILLWFILSTENSPLWRLFVFLTGVFCSPNQLFFGYVEDYTLVYLALITFCILAWKYFDGKKTLPWIILVFLVCLKLHIQMTLCAPALCYLLAHYIARKKPGLKKLYGTPVVVAAVACSLALMTAAYFFLFHAARLEKGDNPEKVAKIFLPLFNYLSSPHNYSLFSLNHLSDVVQEILLTTAPGILIVLAVSTVRRKEVRWFSPRLVFFLLAGFYFILFELTVDPLLTPMRDWDMLSLGSVPVMFAGFELSQIFFEKKSRLSVTLAGAALGLALIPLTFFYVNTHTDNASARLRNLGLWGYNSYYAGSAYMLNVGCALIPDKTKEIEERTRIIRQLEPLASQPDDELGFLYHKLAVTLQSDGDYFRAIAYYRMALDEYPYNASAVKGISVSLLLTGQYQSAAREIAKLNEGINAAGIGDFNSLRIAELAHHCALLEYQHADTSVFRAIITRAQSTFLR